jgi:hypothetical protein
MDLRGDIGMRETMNLLSIVGKKPEKNEKAHIQGAHLKNEKGLE